MVTAWRHENIFTGARNCSTYQRESFTYARAKYFSACPHSATLKQIINCFNIKPFDSILNTDLLNLT